MKIPLLNSLKILITFSGTYLISLVLIARMFDGRSIVNLGTRLLAIEVLFAILVGYFIGRLKNITGAHLLIYSQSLLLSIVMCFTFLFLGPALVERSLTAYLLQEISSRNGKVSEQEISKLALNNWWEGKNQTDFRLREEIEGGYIKKNPDQTISIRILGRIVVAFSKMTKIVFHLQ